MLKELRPIEKGSEEEVGAPRLEGAGVLHIITGLGLGGTAQKLTNLVLANRSSAQHVVISLLDGGHHASELRDAGIEVHCLGLNRLSRVPGAFLRLAMLFRKVRPTKVMTWLYHAHFIGTLAASASGVGSGRVIWNLRSSDLSFAKTSTRWIAKTLSWLSPWPSAISVNSRACRRAHRKLGYRARRWAFLSDTLNLKTYYIIGKFDNSLVRKYKRLIRRKPHRVNDLRAAIVRAYRKKQASQSAVMNRLIKATLRSNLRNKQSIAKRLAEGMGYHNLSETTTRLIRTGAMIGASYGARQTINYGLWWAVEKSGGHYPGQLLKHRLFVKAFAQSLGIQTAKVYEATVPHREIEVRPGTVIKPWNDLGYGRGVFQLQSDGQIFDVGQAEMLESESVLWQRIVETTKRLNDIQATGVNPYHEGDSWVVEELIEGEGCRPPNDLKFYSFYGDIPLISEIQRFPKPGWNWSDADGNRIVTGKYNGTEFEGGGGFTKYDLDVVRRVSLSIPVPFCRIDFVRSKSGELFLTEFTVFTGRFHEFNKKLDRLLGRKFIDAEGRLYLDLLSGVDFGMFRKLANRSLPMFADELSATCAPALRFAEDSGKGGAS